MTDFFQGLSAIGDTLVNNRTRSNRARTLADLGQLFSGDNVDYRALAARLMAAGDIRSGILALKMGEARDAGFGRWRERPGRTRPIRSDAVGDFQPAAINDDDPTTG